MSIPSISRFAVTAAAILAGGFVATSVVPAAVIFDESVNGELNDLYWYATASPIGSWTPVGTLSLGTSTVVGTCTNSFQNSSFSFDGDAISFTIPAGLQLDELIFTRDRSLGIREFFELSGVTASPIYVSRNFPATQLPAGSSDLLNDFPSTGGLLGPGTYVLSFNSNDLPPPTLTMTYAIDLVVIPAPGSVALMACGVVIAWRPRRVRA